MPTTKPKYGQRAVVSVRRFTLSQETLKDLQNWMRQKPDEDLIAVIEDFVGKTLTFEETSHVSPTPAEIRAALDQLLQKSDELYDLIQKTDGYTRQQIQFVRPLDGKVVIFGAGPLDRTQEVLVELLEALEETRKRIQNVRISGGRARTPVLVWRKSLASNLRNLFKQYEGMKTRLTRGQIKVCVDLILDSLPAR